MPLEEKHQDFLLKIRLDELFINGYCKITWPEIYHWFKVERIRAQVWREIDQKWRDLCERREIEPVPITVRSIGNNYNGGVHLFRDHIDWVDGEQQALKDLL